jgi:inorganic triphosphatase YgiF
MAQEVELKFDLAPGDLGRLRSCAALSPGPGRKARHRSIYYDTIDGALRKAGLSLRVRRSGDRYVQTAKLRRSDAAGLFVRDEWESEVAGFDPDCAALRSKPLSRALNGRGGKGLVSPMAIDVWRTHWEVERDGSRIEVALDEGKVTSGKAEAPLCELELELREGTPAALFALAEEIGRAVPLRLGTLTKAERGEALAGRKLGRAAKAEPIAIDAKSSEAEAFRAVAYACLRHYRLNETVLLGAHNAEALHQARIALRRLRSALSLFRPTARGAGYRALRDELGWLARQFGEARNLDVLIAGEAGRGDHVLRSRLLEARAEAYERVDAVLASDRARALMLRLASWIEAGPWRGRPRAARSVAGLAARQLARRWLRLRRDGDGLAKASAEAQHRLRLETKKLRYAAEFLTGLWPEPPLAEASEHFLAALKDLQESLGELNDDVAAGEIIGRLAPGLRIATLRRPGHREDRIAAAEAALRRAEAAAGYWR